MQSCSSIAEQGSLEAEAGREVDGRDRAVALEASFEVFPCPCPSPLSCPHVLVCLCFWALLSHGSSAVQETA